MSSFDISGIIITLLRYSHLKLKKQGNVLGKFSPYEISKNDLKMSSVISVFSKLITMELFHEWLNQSNSLTPSWNEILKSKLEKIKMDE